MNKPSSFRTPYQARQGKGALFVDLDETLLQGTVTKMNDGALSKATLNEGVLSLIRSAVSNGIKVVLVTRNDPQNADRFFQFFPHVRSLFNAIFASTSQDKSQPIARFLKHNNLSVEKSQFLDDLFGERDEVSGALKGIVVSHPSTAKSMKEIELKKSEGVGTTVETN